MTLFLTEFPISQDKSTDDILRLAYRWIAGIKHSHIKNILTAEQFLFQEHHLEYGLETFHSLRHKAESQDIAGLQYAFNDDISRRWITEITAAKFRDRFWLSTKVSCDSATTARTLPTPKKPYIIKLFLHEKLGARDGGIITSDQPIFLDKTHIDLAASVMNGESSNHLPVVYVSSRSDQHAKYIAEPSLLARHLGGLAHVLVEPSSNFSPLLARLTSFQNPYDGAIGVYWPDGAGRKIFLIGDTYPTGSDIIRGISRDIVLALANRRPVTECSWQFLQEQQSIRAIQKLKDEGSTNVTEYVNAFDAEIQVKNQRLAESETEIARLKSELQKKNINKGGANGILNFGKESDLYPNEIRSIALSAIKHGCTQALDDSRRKHVLEDILEANSIYTGDPGIEQEIKNILSDYKKMDVATKATLLGLGFDITEEGKHYKSVFAGDPRYTFAIPKTPSDFRSGKNLASDICKKLFK